MKLLVLSILLVVVVAVVAKPPPKFKTCDSSEDCELDECCVMRGFSGKGWCKPRGKENDIFPTESKFPRKQYVGFCPCSEGLSCEAEEVIDFFGLKVKINERCISGDTTPAHTTAVEEVTTEAVTDSGCHGVRK